jgi:hypothetical protein
LNLFEMLFSDGCDRDQARMMTLASTTWTVINWENDKLYMSCAYRWMSTAHVLFLFREDSRLLVLIQSKVSKQSVPVRIRQNTILDDFKIFHDQFSASTQRSTFVFFSSLKHQNLNNP